jgi:2-methylisocitrate lyase-like PEP mutase family enzyme
MNEQQAESLKQYIDAAIEHALASREPGADGYFASARTEQQAKEEAWAAFKTLLK